MPIHKVPRDEKQQEQDVEMPTSMLNLLVTGRHLLDNHMRETAPCLAEDGSSMLVRTGIIFRVAMVILDIDPAAPGLLSCYP